MKFRLAFEYKIPIIYIIIGALWILFSDEIVTNLTSDPQKIQLLSTYKGWAYVLVTGIMLYLLIKKELNRRNALSNELLEAKKKALESEQLKSAFLSNLSHHIRTPMNGIIGFVRLLQNKDKSPDDKQRFLTFINEQSQTLLETLNSIIEISKLQEGQANLLINTFHINELITDIIDFERIDITEQSNLSIKTTFAFSNKEDEMTSDRNKIKQILSCLFSNAIHFTEKGVIEIGYFTENGNITFYIKDSGTGVSPDKQKLIFNDLMFNTKYSYSKGEGAGLGLYLSSELSKLLGGKLWLENTGDCGSTFCFSIPRNM